MTPATSIRSARGTGLVSTCAAVLVFLIFLLFAVQLLMNLYATSTVSAAGYDAARAVASHHVDHRDPARLADAEQRAEARARSLLGGIGRDAEFSWSIDDRVVRLHLSVLGPGILPRATSSLGGPHRIDRTFVVRVEDER
ncbi:MAG: hypothetical protein JWM47_1456 [Acidimicrobiales bacterium]|nr:hypothetical protein [Acidimicrobiales bacterium]